MPKIEIRIGKDSIKVQAQDFQGQGCLDEVNRVLSQMDINAVPVKKDEYYQESKTNTSLKLNQGNS